MAALLVVLLTFVGAFVGTITGFGSSTILVPTLSLFYPLPETLFFAGIIHWFVDVWKIFLFKRGLNWKLIWLFGLPGIIVAFAAAGLPGILPEFELKKLLGLFLVGYVIFIFKKPRWRLKPTNLNAALGGGLSGLTAAVFGVGGAVRSAFLTAFNLDKSIYIFTSGAIGLLIDTARLSGYWLNHFSLKDYGPTTLVWAILVSFLAAALAKKMAGRLNRQKFRRLVLVALFIVGLGYLIFTGPKTAAPSASWRTTTNQAAEDNPANPMPFEKLTIPYLKNRSYQSRLGQLNLALESDDYIAYLTSYASDGLKVNGLLYVPKAEPPPAGFPTVVFIHGYIPPANYRTLENYHAYASYLAEQGLVVFKIDLRGHDQSEGQASGAYYSGDYVIDTLNAYAALESFDLVNPNRIGLWGHSMAGNVVMRALAAKPDIPKVVIWAGAVYTYEDWQEYRLADRSYRPPGMDDDRRRRREELFATHGEFDPSSSFWSQVPATNFLDGVQGAIQIHHAENDNVVNIGYSQNLIQILNTTAIPHQLFEYPSGAHNLAGAVFNTAMSRTAYFFKN